MDGDSFVLALGAADLSWREIARLIVIITTIVAVLLALYVSIRRGR